MKKRSINGIIHYYVSWKEYGNTWEPFYHLQNCRNLITAFEKQHKKKLRSKIKKRKYEESNLFVFF